MAYRDWRWQTFWSGLLFLVAAGVSVVIVRTLLLESHQVETVPASELTVADQAPQRLSTALQFRTVTSRDPAQLDSAAFESLYAYFDQAFPRVHETLDVRRVSDLSRLYTWPGSDSTLAPIVLMAHVDVVPVEDSSAWTHPPFQGRVTNGYVWGRGALDDKASAVGILEAIESLLQQGETPSRTVHVAFGHDEEVGGPRGARALAEQITEMGDAPALVLDEGGAITRGALPGLEDPLAAVGVAEKGYLSLRLKAERPGGHSSVPPEETSIGVLNEAISRLQANPLPTRLDGVTGQTFEYVAPEMDVPMQVAFANQWLTASLLRWRLNKVPAAKAATRTTTVPTRLDAGVKDNVIPTTAEATVNFRILPSQSVASVVDHVRTTLEGLSIQLTPVQSNNPTSVSAVGDSTFRVLQRTIGQVTADSVVVAPILVPGTTDSRYYAEHTDHVYRFVPYQLTEDDRSRIHGVDERISTEDYNTVVQFYKQVIQNGNLLPHRSS